METYGQGNDLTIVLNVVDSEGKAYSLENKRISIWLLNPRGRMPVSEFTVEDNVVVFVFRGKNQTVCGTYGIRLIVMSGGRQMTISVPNIFMLEDSGCPENSAMPEGLLEGNRLEVTSVVSIYRIAPIVPVIGENGTWWVDGEDTGIHALGKSAYEIAVEYGFAGTEEEWLASMRKPAEDAAEKCLETERKVSEAESSRKTEEASRVRNEEKRESAEALRVEQESTRISAEKKRLSAEQERVTAEEARVIVERNRVKAEQERATAEEDRKKAEQSRAESEQTRVTAEQDRVSAEQAMQTAEKERAAAESLRASAEQKRAAAESLRVSAEQKRAAAEQSREKAEQERVAAEEGRMKAEQGRVTAEAERAEAFSGMMTEAKAATSSAEAAAKTATDTAVEAYKAAVGADEAAENAQESAALAQENVLALEIDSVTGRLEVVVGADRTAFTAGQITEKGEVILEFNYE